MSYRSVSGELQTMKVQGVVVECHTEISPSELPPVRQTYADLAGKRPKGRIVRRRCWVSICFIEAKYDGEAIYVA